MNLLGGCGESAAQSAESCFVKKMRMPEEKSEEVYNDGQACGFPVRVRGEGAGTREHMPVGVRAGTARIYNGDCQQLDDVEEKERQRIFL